MGLNNIWPFEKLYRLKDQVDGLKAQLHELKKNQELQEKEFQSMHKMLEFQKHTLELEMEEYSKEFESYKGIQQSEYELYKENHYNDLWRTKFGYDWMLSDLQMSLIEYLVPGNREKLLALKDSHKGEKCFVIGNGSSLKAEDLDKLKEHNIFSFGSKRINLIFDHTQWRPDIWGVSDLDYIQLYRDEISALHGFPKLVCVQSILKHDIFVEDAIYYPFIQMERTPRWFNADIMRGVHFWGTITCKLINIAVYMGFKEIYLLGVDNTFPIQKDEKGNYKYELKKMKHFSYEYHTKGEAEEVMKNVGDMLKAMKYVEQSYRSVKWHCDKIDVNIVNATRGGELEVFPRVEFDKVFKEAYHM